MTLPDVRWQPRCLAACLVALLVVLASAHVRGDDPPGGAYRLPGHLVPTNYKLKLVPYLEKDNFKYTGQVDILVKCKAETKDVVLHAHKDLTVTLIGVRDEATQTNLEFASTPVRDDEKQFLTYHGNKPETKLEVDKEYTISLSFENELQKDNYGFYLSSYSTGSSFEYMATTHFEATSARKAFPCFDEPIFRATFDISVAKLDDQIALSNMPPASEPSDYDPAIGNRRWVTFQTTPKMPTYLVAFIVCKLKMVPTSNPKINVYVRANAVEGVTKAAEVAPKLLTALENLLDVKYPLPKLDLVAIPDFPAGAMENWGLITFKEDMLLVTEGVSTADREAKSLRVIAHEFAHLWFGDLVTLQWWNTIWQQEGMAAFMESYILDLATSEEYEAMSRLGTTRVQTALEADSLEHSPPLTKNDIQSPAQIEEHFGTITYSKGSNVHYMLRNILGDKVYAAGLNNYLKKNEYSATTPKDLAEALQQAVTNANKTLPGDITIQAVIDSWADQSGYPVLTVLRDYANNRATVSQQRFLSHEPADPDIKKTTWVIPYSINSVFEKNDDFTNVLLAGETEKMVDLSTYLEPGGYLWANRKQSGFYRVNYDTHNWLLLANAASRLDAASRASLLDDVYALNRAGLIDTWLPLWYLQSTLGDTSNSGERDMAPWITAAKVLRGYSALTRGDPELSTYFQTYVSLILAPAFKAVGWSNQSDTSNNQFKRSVVRDTITQLACDAGIRECRVNAMMEYLSPDDDTDKDPNVMAAKLCEGVKTMNAQDLAGLVATLINTEDVTARTSYIRAAGCAKTSSSIDK